MWSASKAWRRPEQIGDEAEADQRRVRRRVVQVQAEAGDVQDRDEAEETGEPRPTRPRRRTRARAVSAARPRETASFTRPASLAWPLALTPLNAARRIGHAPAAPSSTTAHAHGTHHDVDGRSAGARLRPADQGPRLREPVGSDARPPAPRDRGPPPRARCALALRGEPVLHLQPPRAQAVRSGSWNRSTGTTISWCRRCTSTSTTSIASRAWCCKGPALAVRAFADQTQAEKGVRHGVLNLVTVKVSDAHFKLAPHQHPGHLHLIPRS